MLAFSGQYLDDVANSKVILGAGVLVGKIILFGLAEFKKQTSSQLSYYPHA